VVNRLNSANEILDTCEVIKDLKPLNFKRSGHGKAQVKSSSWQQSID